MIRTRLSLWNAAVLALVLTLLGVVVFFGARQSLYGVVDEDLLRRGAFLGTNWESRPKERPRMAPPQMKPDPSIDPAKFKEIEFEWFIARPRIWEKARKPEREDDVPWNMPAVYAALRGETRLFDSTIEGRRVRIYSIPLREKGKITAAGQFAASLEGADIGVGRIGRILLILLPLSLVATSVVGVWLTRRALQPVAEITRAAERIEATNLSDRLLVQSKDEFGQLAGVFNSMLARLESAFRKLEEAFETQRRFTADASHELKTPLTAIKARLGVAKRQAPTPEKYHDNLASIERSANAMSAIVADLLLLAQIDDGRMKKNARRLPLDSLAEESVAVVEDAFDRKIETSIEEGLNLVGDESGLSRVFVNLLDNAVRHTPPDGRVRLEAKRVGDRIVARVIDSGSGIPAADLPHVFDRFYRVSEARDRDSGGTGLGLSIVRSIVLAHGGEVRIESKVGVGTTVTVELPAEPSI